MSDTRRKSKAVKSTRRGDLRLSVVRRGFPDFTRRQIQRWAESGTIPGGYKLRRGHWRIRDCPAFRRWWKARSPVPLRWAIEGYRPPGYDVKGLFVSIEKHRPMLDKLTAVVALKTRSGMDGWRITKPDLDDPDHALWHGPLTEIPQALYTASRRADKGALDVAVVVGELQAKGIAPTASAVAERMSESRASFYRRSHDADLRRCLRALDTGEAVSKDSRARKLYRDKFSQ